MPQVSVIIPFYENVKWLEEAVDSVFSQTYNDYEIIVVNDGSKEDVRSFLEKYIDNIIYVYKENGGPSSARNAGMKKAHGNYIAFLDSDDKWLPDKLSVQVDAMVRYNVVWSYCGYNTFGEGKSMSYTMTDAKIPVLQRFNTPYIATPCVMIDNEFLNKNPDIVFDTRLRYGQDALFWLKINANNPILAIPNELVEVRIRGGNASKKARKQIAARGEVWKYRKEDREELIDKYQLSKLYIHASELCLFANRIVKRIDDRIGESAVEFLSKIMFVLPWLLFKIDRKVHH